MRQIIAFFGIGLVLLAGLNWLARLPGGDLREQDMRLKLAQISGKQAVTLGASQANGFDLSVFCVDGVDYHLTQDVFEMAAVADFALGRPRPPRLWFVILPPASQSIDNASPGAGWAGQRHATYRALYSQGYRGLIGGDWRQALTANLMPGLGDEAWRPHMRWVAERLGYRRRGIAESRAVMSGRLDRRAAAPLARELWSRRETLLRRTAYYTPDVPRRATGALLAMNEAIRRSGGRMIVVVPPMVRETRDAATRGMPDQLRGFRSLLARLTAAGAIVRDHWADPRFEGRYDLFWDPEHLNVAGGGILSRLVARDLRGPLELDRRCRRPN